MYKYSSGYLIIDYGTIKSEAEERLNKVGKIGTTKETTVLWGQRRMSTAEDIIDNYYGSSRYAGVRVWEYWVGKTLVASCPA